MNPPIPNAGEARITCLFVEIGGVLLSDGWSHLHRQKAAKVFNLDWADLEQRHHLASDAYEMGKLTLTEYLNLVVFNVERPFTPEQFTKFMYDQSSSFPEMLDLLRDLKQRHGLKIVVVSNEGRELNAHRIRTFKLDQVVDVFVSSCFVHLRKPDLDFFRLAIDLAQVPLANILYIENTAMFAHLVQGMGIRTILHIDPASTREGLAAIGLVR